MLSSANKAQVLRKPHDRKLFFPCQELNWKELDDNKTDANAGAAIHGR